MVGRSEAHSSAATAAGAPLFNGFSSAAAFSFLLLRGRRCFGCFGLAYGPFRLGYPSLFPPQLMGRERGKQGEEAV